MACGLIRPQAAGLKFCQRITAHETIETKDDITRKNSLFKQTITDADTDAGGESKMTKPSFRFFIIPLGAICTLASLSSQNTAPRALRDTGSMVVRQQVVDCTGKNPSEICVISYDSETSAR
jgi:hypothetical protein